MHCIRIIILIAGLFPVFVEAQSLQNRLINLLDSVYQSKPEALGILVHVEAPAMKLSWTAAAGFADTSRSDKLKADQAVLLASNTKPYVAAATLRLVEKGNFKLEDPIGELLSPETIMLLEKSAYNLDAIQVKHLLSHTSGIRDYVDQEYFRFVLDEPHRHWTRDKQIERAVNLGKPLAGPGVQFKYGDINYLLLTEIMERQTQKPFYQSMRELLKYDQLGIKETWFNELENVPESSVPMAHQYAQNFQLDSYEIDPSWDLYGGGGIASTAKESALFFQYLFEGKIIEDEVVLENMYSYVLPPEQSRYCLGVYHFDFGYNLYYHGGWWGTDVNYSPETNASVSVFTLVREVSKEVNPFLGKRIQEILLAISKEDK